MNGLKPNTTYTVYLSNGYAKYVEKDWVVTRTWGINVEYQGGNYPETLVLDQNETLITSGSLDTDPPALASHFDVAGGSVIGNKINIEANNGSLYLHMVGTIAPDGTMSGTWADKAPGTRTGTWASTSGAAVKTYTGGTGWPGLFTDTIQPFTFMTDELGSGSWHLNLREENIADTESQELSVWINDGGTLLVSDVFQVTK
jgi:hypothetical protein